MAEHSLATAALPQARVLVVDDHPGTATTLARAISQLGPEVEVLSATSGKMALEQVKDNAVDLLITDMMMPEMNGLELIEKMQSHPGGAPAYTILITAYDVPGLKESARRLKVNETIVKPFRPERICQIVSKALEQLEPSKPVKPASAIQRAYKILIADDMPDNLSLLSRYLENEGYSYITANNGTRALEKTRADMPDLILLDVNMPEKDGFEVLREIRADPAVEHIPVIILTAARPDPVDVRAGLNLGADDYVTKPFDRRELLARIRNKLRARESESAMKQRYKALSVLPEIGRDLSARLDLDELTNIILRRSVETLGALVGHLFLLDTVGQLHKEYRIPTTNFPSFEIQVPLLKDLVEQIKGMPQGMLIEDAHNNPRWQELPDIPTSSMIVVPLFGRLEVIGFIILIHEQTGYFKSEHQLLLQAIASQAAIALENVHICAEMSRERQRFETILQCAADAILTFDTEGNLTMLNPSGEALLGDASLQLGRPLPRQQGFDALIDLLDRVRSTQKSETTEINGPEGRTFSLLMTPIEHDGYVTILHDVTHFKELERVKDEFISAASHDLKNPLSVITGYMDLLPQVGALNKKQTEYIQRMHTAAESMGGLAGTILDLVKVTTNVELHLELVDVSEMLEKLAHEYQPQTRAKKQTLVLESGGDLPMIEADPFQLLRALRNLVGNAVKYTSPNGEIKISAEARDDKLSIQVTDNGNGISPEDLPFIFDRFYRAKNADSSDKESSGLGLAIVKSIVEQHKGTISVESERGEGSCFTLTLPLMQSELSAGPLPQ